MTDQDDENDDEADENIGVDQVVTDLAILEHQLINSVTQRRDPLFIRPDLKDTIISDLDHYFEDKSSSLNEQSKAESLQQEQAANLEHLPYITAFNRTSSQTKIRIDGLEHAQMYMFQVYACHDIARQSKADACSLNGIIITVRTKPGDRMSFPALLLLPFRWASSCVRSFSRPRSGARCSSAFAERKLSPSGTGQ